MLSEYNDCSALTTARHNYTSVNYAVCFSLNVLCGMVPAGVGIVSEGFGSLV